MEISDFQVTGPEQAHDSGALEVLPAAIKIKLSCALAQLLNFARSLCLTNIRRSVGEKTNGGGSLLLLLFYGTFYTREATCLSFYILTPYNP